MPRWIADVAVDRLANVISRLPELEATASASQLRSPDRSSGVAVHVEWIRSDVRVGYLLGVDCIMPPDVEPDCVIPPDIDPDFPMSIPVPGRTGGGPPWPLWR